MFGWLKRGGGGGAGEPFVDGEEVAIAGTAATLEPGGKLRDAPLSGLACVCFTTMIGIPEQRAPLTAARVGLVVGVAMVGAAFDVRITGGRGGNGPNLVWFRGHGGTRFAVDTKRGRLVIDATSEAAPSGPPLVLIPRDLERERALLASWELTDAFPRGQGLADAVFREVIVAVGHTIDVRGAIVRGEDGEARLSGAEIRTRR